MNLNQVTNYLGFTKPKQIDVVVPVQPVTTDEKVVLFTWETLARSTAKVMSPKMVKTMMVIAIVVCLILALMQEFVLILAIGSIAFISYALSKTPAEHVKHEVTNHGVSFAGQQYLWGDLKNFFFSTTNGHEVLVVSTRDTLPGRLFFSFNPQDREKLKEIFAKYLTFLEQEPVTVLDRVYNSAVDKLNLDK